VCSVANRYARKPSLDGAILLPPLYSAPPAAWVLIPGRSACPDVLGLDLHTGVRRLELFARNLRPGWTSWGILPHLDSLTSTSLTMGGLVVVVVGVSHLNKQATRCCCFRSSGTSNRSTRAAT
jgi:hypothetical protein